MNRIIILFLLTVNICISSFSQQKVSFIREYIDFTIDSSYFTINGIYTFANTSEKPLKQEILYPFLPEIRTIDSVRVINVNTFQNVPYWRNEKGIWFNFEAMPLDTIQIAIFYRQKTAKSNTYILTTTKYWGKPLEIANYSLQVAKNITVDNFSIFPDDSKIFADRTIYFWKKLNFLPEVDFSFVIR